MSVGGLSKERLERMHDVMAGYVERGAVPGLVSLVSRRGEVHVDVVGTKAVAGRDPVKRDTIFRISSMTKPVTQAAWTRPRPPDIALDFWTSAYQAIDD
jgi:CubicO group peptidase (beta-lactamase class C family)